MPWKYRDSFAESRSSIMTLASGDSVFVSSDSDEQSLGDYQRGIQEESASDSDSYEEGNDLDHQEPEEGCGRGNHLESKSQLWRSQPDLSSRSASLRRFQRSSKLSPKPKRRSSLPLLYHPRTPCSPSPIPRFRKNSLIAKNALRAAIQNPLYAKASASSTMERSRRSESTADRAIVPNKATASTVTGAPKEGHAPPSVLLRDSSHHISCSSYYSRTGSHDQSTLYEEHSSASEESFQLPSSPKASPSQATNPLFSKSSADSPLPRLRSSFAVVSNPFSRQTPLPFKSSEQRKASDVARASLRALNQTHRWNLLKHATLKGASLVVRPNARVSSTHSSSSRTNDTLPLEDEDDGDRGLEDLESQEVHRNHSSVLDDPSRWVHRQKEAFRQALLQQTNRTEGPTPETLPADDEVVGQVARELLANAAKKDALKRKAILRIQAWVRATCLTKPVARRRLSDCLAPTIQPVVASRSRRPAQNSSDPNFWSSSFTLHSSAAVFEC